MSNTLNGKSDDNVNANGKSGYTGIQQPAARLWQKEQRGRNELEAG